MSKKILIIGNSAKEYALAKKLSENNEVYVAPGSPSIKDFATCVDRQGKRYNIELDNIRGFEDDFEK